MHQMYTLNLKQLLLQLFSEFKLCALFISVYTLFVVDISFIPIPLFYSKFYSKLEFNILLPNLLSNIATKLKKLRVHTETGGTNII